MKIIISNDHAAVELKKSIMQFLKEESHQVVNVGVDIDESVDYPDMAEKACREFLKGGYDFGILFCGTGIGISIAANKIKGIRCAAPVDVFSARMAKEHNDANFIAFGSRIEYRESVTDMINAYINAGFQGNRHQQRVEKISRLEEHG